MQDLIVACPNVVPSGLGNGNSNLDMSIFTYGQGAASDCNDEEGGEEASSPNDDAELQSDDGEESEDSNKPDKHKGKEMHGE